MLRVSFQLAALALLPASAFAGQVEWEVGTIRGMTTYRFERSNWEVLIACDPDRVFEVSSAASIQVAIHSSRPSGQFAILANSGEQAVFDMKDGGIEERLSDQAVWRKMAGIIGAGGRMAFVTSTQSLEIDLAVPTDFKCTAE